MVALQFFLILVLLFVFLLFNFKLDNIIEGEQEILDLIAAEKGKLAALKAGIDKLLSASTLPDGSIDAAGVAAIKAALADEAAATDAIVAEIPA